MMSDGTRRLIGLLGSALLISACGSHSESHPESAPDGDASSQNEAAMPVADSAFGDMAGTMDRARGVETTEMEHKEAVDRAIDQNAGGAPAE